MTEGGQGERGRHADVRQCWMKATGNEQTTAVLVSYFVAVVRARCFMTAAAAGVPNSRRLVYH